MNKQFQNYLKFKIYQQAYQLDKQQNDYRDLKSLHKSKEETYQGIITYLQTENIRLLNFILYHNNNNNN
jgi:hypothetical protein